MEEGMESQHLCLRLHCLSLCCLLRKCFLLTFSLSPLPCPKSRHTYAHTDKKADNTSLWSSGTRKQQLCSMLSHSNSKHQPVLKQNTALFIMSWILALHLIYYLPLLSAGGTAHVMSWLTRLSTKLQQPVLEDVCIPSFCYYLELCVYGACSLQIHLKHQQHSLASKQACGCKSCLMITQGLVLQVSKLKYTIGHWKSWSVSQPTWGERTYTPPPPPPPITTTTTHTHSLTHSETH